VSAASLALLALLTALFAAPLVLGSFLVLQGAGPLARLLWFGALTALLLTVLLAAGGALLLLMA
jgi:hypothetical protein